MRTEESGSSTAIRANQWDAERAHSQAISTWFEIRRICKDTRTFIPMVDATSGRPRNVKGDDGISRICERIVFRPIWEGTDHESSFYDLTEIELRHLDQFPSLKKAYDKVRFLIFFPPFHKGLKWAIDDMKTEIDKIKAMGEWWRYSVKGLAEYVSGYPSSDSRFGAVRKKIRRLVKEWESRDEVVKRDIAENPRGQQKEWRGDFVMSLTSHYEDIRAENARIKRKTPPPPPSLHRSSQ